MSTLNEDVLFRSKTVHALLGAIPKSHPLFPVVLRRLWELPVYLDTYDAVAASGEILDYLLAVDASEEARAIAEAIRHLVIAAETGRKGEDWEYKLVDKVSDVVGFCQRLSELFERTPNLRSISYYCYPGIPLSYEDLKGLATCKRLQTFAVDTAVRETNWADYDALRDTEIWDIEPFLRNLAPSITSLELRHICMSMLNIIVSHKALLASYKDLEHLRMDITEGAWDWEGGPSTPPVGASSEFIFHFLGLPAIRRFELVVSDLTIHKPQMGPLNLVDCKLLTELSLDIRRSLYGDMTRIEIFMVLSDKLPALSHLEITDNNSSARKELEWEPRQWRHRYFPGLVDPFLGSLSNLSSLWVDQSALLPGYAETDWWGESHTFCDVRELWDASTYFHSIDIPSWKMALQAVLWQMESLRVGFGIMDDIEVGLVLACCDPAKLRQFGFTWAWHQYGRDDPISPELLTHLARFPGLTDLHILLPRPGTQVSGDPNPVIDARMLGDVVAIFKSNSGICRVGMGNSVVWERGPGGDGSEIILVADGSSAPDPSVPKFYRAGYLANPQFPLDDYNAAPRRPGRTEEIKQLRDLLKRILE
ncbi:hypothetical protein C8R46DRAFT_1060739 [Mycena filopes]|nr:hypothetical protein C8R46DRAFT_1060739 [Mycena filopes]